MTKMTTEELKTMIGEENAASLGNEAALEQFAEQINCCETEDDFLKAVCGVNGGGEEELSEEELTLVVGGMSNWKAIQIVSSAYWDLCVRKKKKSRYSDKQIYTAIEICDDLMEDGEETCKKWMLWGLKKLLGL